MRLSLDAMSKILGIDGDIPLTCHQMKKGLKITYFPATKQNKELENFKYILNKVFQNIGIEIVQFEDVLVTVRGRRKIKKGYITIVLGEPKADNIALDNVESYDHNPIITIINTKIDFERQFTFQQRTERGFELLSMYGPNLVICVCGSRWILYSMNGFTQVYDVDVNSEADVLKYLIPKIATRVAPLSLNDFLKKKMSNKFVQENELLIEDLILSGDIFSLTGIFPARKNLDKVKWRSERHRLLASIFLDKRTGVSFGFLARQLPTKLPELMEYDKYKSNFCFGENDYCFKSGRLYILVEVIKENYIMEVPEISVLMTRSGSEKTKLDSKRDILKIGLNKGKLIMETSAFVSLDADDCKPSFDTRLVLANCVGNAIIGAIQKRIDKSAIFANLLEKKGMAICHWHGDFEEEFIPRGWYIHGGQNPSVLCSSPQSAVYALKGKMLSFEKSLKSGVKFCGDIHIEPHHGINMTWHSLSDLAKYILMIHKIMNVSTKSSLYT